MCIVIKVKPERRCFVLICNRMYFIFGTSCSSAEYARQPGIYVLRPQLRRCALLTLFVRAHHWLQTLNSITTPRIREGGGPEFWGGGPNQPIFDPPPPGGGVKNTPFFLSSKAKLTPVLGQNAIQKSGIGTKIVENYAFFVLLPPPPKIDFFDDFWGFFRLFGVFRILPFLTPPPKSGPPPLGGGS